MAELYALRTPRFHRTGTLTQLVRTRTTHGAPWAQFDLRLLGDRLLRGSAFDDPAERLIALDTGRPVTLFGYSRVRSVIEPDGTLRPAERFTVLKVLEPLHPNPARADWLALEREAGIPADLDDPQLLLHLCA
jgi:hypothetical protein